MAKTVFDVLSEAIREKIDSTSDVLASGAAKDYPEYRELCGLIRGLEHALREVNDLSRKFLDEDNDD
jgi:hypothetical protein